MWQLEQNEIDDCQLASRFGISILQAINKRKFQLSIVLLLHKTIFLERKYFYQNMFVFIVTKIHKCNILCKQTTQKQIEPTWVFVNVDIDVHTIMYFQFAISRNISQDKILFVCAKKSFCFTDFGVRLFILQLSLRLRSGILHVYLFLFVYRSFFAFTNVYVSLLSHFSVFLPFRLWQIINWQACETYICRFLFTGKALVFLEKIVFFEKHFFRYVCKKLEAKKQTDI